MRQFVGLFALLALASCRGGDGPQYSRTEGGLVSEVHLGQARRITGEGYFLAPRFSFDGRYLMFAGPKYNGIFVASVDGSGGILTVTDEDYVGFPARWTKDGIETRTRDGGILVFRDPLGRGERIATGETYDPKRPKGKVHAYHEDDAIHLVIAGEDRVISDGKDRYFAPLVSPDSNFIVYEGLLTGLYLYDVAKGRTVAVGRGNNPAWLPDSSGFLYDVTEDDGVRLTAGEIYAYFISEGRSVRLTDTKDLIETHPAPSPDGRLVAFESEGAIYVAPLEYRR